METPELLTINSHFDYGHVTVRNFRETADDILVVNVNLLDNRPWGKFRDFIVIEL